MGDNQAAGSIPWRDLTVVDAKQVRDFYEQVVGWKVDEVPVGDYHDYLMNDAGGNAVAGICHAKGDNANLPPQWLVYITVVDLEASIEQCKALGGKVVSPQRSMGSYGTVCVIQDPAGAVAALIQPPPAEPSTEPKD